ncbi:MAG: ABC transporter substrate-binding protein [Clostridia bacterium]|nr:ABC transporter substrate-binding protein [Clostridia bacterium]
MKFKINLKRAAAFAAAASIFTAVSGCGKKANVEMEDPNTLPSDSYEINWYLPGKTLHDISTVENEINAYLKDKINATVKINILENAQYKEKLSNMIQAGEYFDMCFAADWMLNYATNAENGAFVALDDMLEKYMPKTYDIIDKSLLEGARIDGKIYGLPVIKESSMCYGWIYRKDIADKYGIDMSKVKSFEDLEPIAKMIKEKEPDIKYPVDWNGDQSPSGSISGFDILAANVLGCRGGDDTFTVVNKMDLPETLEQFKLGHRFYTEGLIKEDILTNFNDYTQRLKNGQAFCVLMPLKPGKVGELLKNSNYEFAQEYVQTPKKMLNAGSSSLNVISVTSKNPGRVARFMELLNTDEYLNNLVVYGVEGRHYEKVSDKVVKVIPEGGYTLSGSQWMIANIYLNYTTVEEEPDKYEQLKKFDEEATPNLLNGFRFVTQDIQAELAACAAVTKQYGNQVSLGALDPEPILETYRRELNNAGIEKIKIELQKQINEFIKNKKS